MQKSSLNLKMKAPWSSEHQKILTPQKKNTHRITTQKTWNFMTHAHHPSWTFMWT